jgi:hypothetical protein
MSRSLLHLSRLLCGLLPGLLAGLPLHATSVKPPAFDELVNGADYVVRARVTAVETVVTPRPGQRPGLHTRVSLEVLETIAGTAPAPLVLTLLGGRTADYELRVEGVPVFTVGDEDILFVHGNGRTFYPLYAVMHGRYRIRKDEAGRDYIARSNDVPMADVAEVALPMTEGGAAALQQKFKAKSSALTPAAFAEQIRSVRHAK